MKTLAIDQQIRSAVMVWTLMQNNGLKVNVLLDGEEIYGPYLKYPTESGKGFVIGHGLPEGGHVLELTVAQASKIHNKLDSIGICIYN